MAVHQLDAFIKGSYNDPSFSGNFTEADFEKEHRIVYDDLMSRLSRVVSVKESGRWGDADLAMSRWVDPSRVIVVVVRTARGRDRKVIEAAFDAIRDVEPDYAVLFDDDPNQVCVCRDGVVMGVGTEEGLTGFGFPPYA